MNWKTLVLQMTVMVLSLNPKTAPLVPFLGPAIADAEDMKGKTGPQKLAIVVKLVQQGLEATNALRPGKVNLAIADEVIASATSAVVDSVNVYKKAGLIVNKSAPPVAA